MTDAFPVSSMRCPVCRAEQAWSAECRRCKCDLTLLWEAQRAVEQLQCDCLAALACHDFAEALRLARQAWQWQPDEINRRRLAICSLLLGDWPTALRLARLP